MRHAILNAIERQILLNQMAIIEALIPLSARGMEGTRELLGKRYQETAQLVRERTNPPQGR
jgi:hypothetical protein